MYRRLVFRQCLGAYVTENKIRKVKFTGLTLTGIQRVERFGTERFWT